jgi:cytochrome c2
VTRTCRAGLVARKAGTAPNLAYSDSLKDSCITWDEPTLDKWVTTRTR